MLVLEIHFSHVGLGLLIFLSPSLGDGTVDRCDSACMVLLFWIDINHSYVGDPSVWSSMGLMYCFCWLLLMMSFSLLYLLSFFFYRNKTIWTIIFTLVTVSGIFHSLSENMTSLDHFYLNMIVQKWKDNWQIYRKLSFSLLQVHSQAGCHRGGQDIDTLTICYNIFKEHRLFLLLLVLVFIF